jgi:hypothetical protein
MLTLESTRDYLEEAVGGSSRFEALARGHGPRVHALRDSVRSFVVAPDEMRIYRQKRNRRPRATVRPRSGSLHTPTIALRLAILRSNQQAGTLCFPDAQRAVD